MTGLEYKEPVAGEPEPNGEQARLAATPSPLPPATAGPDDYDLAIDAQVEKFVETKQKLTYFLITASVAVIAFTIDFFVEHARGEQASAITPESALVVASALAGLATAGFSLLNLRFEHRSYSLHLAHRYRRKTWNSLTPTQQQRWDRITVWAARLLVAAFALLFLEIGLAVAFFVVFLW
jgi:hypothetical protein